ncbi:MAG: hypothetical protein EU547_04265 [Promethearchaeota archaeon]|nr:MAG: hypothetical protein EU547_04265 [Candidatus Lokiarchaeota archaeon]
MASKEYLIQEEIIYTELFEPRVILNAIKPKFIQDFLEPFKNHIPTDLTKEFRLDIRIRKKDNKKYNPFLRLAKPEEAKDIACIVKDDYEGTYPYKEMEDPEEIKRMIESGKYKFILFLTEEGEIIGSTCFVVDLKEKKGYLRSLVVKKDWIGILDAKKAYMVACLVVWNVFKNKISLWWAETRTADAKTQYITRECGLRPIAWFPNKDIFYNKIESDLLIIAYNKDRIEKNRSNKLPEIIPSVMGCYSFSKINYNLETPRLLEHDTIFDKEKILKLQKQIKIHKKEKNYHYIKYKLSFDTSASYFEFIYTPRVHNFEKTKYKVRNPSELFVFLKTFLSLANKLNVRYVEAYVSAYKPFHQQVFSKIGLTPRGYIPAWKLNHYTNLFEDYILFNWYKRKINEMKLTQESEILLDFIKA